MEKDNKKTKTNTKKTEVKKKPTSNTVIKETNKSTQKREIKAIKNETNKPNKVKMQKLQTEENQIVRRFLVVLIVVILCVVGIYFFTRAFVTKDLFEDKKEATKETAETSFNYDITILGAAFNRPHDEYYVISYKKSDEQANYLSTLIQTYLQKENHLKIYMADLDDYMNKSFYDKENINSKATTASELKVGDYTLIKFKNGAISKFIEGTEKIAEELK